MSINLYKNDNGYKNNNILRNLAIILFLFLSSAQLHADDGWVRVNRGGSETIEYGSPTEPWVPGYSDSGLNSDDQHTNFPTKNRKFTAPPKGQISSGTGFFINNRGYLITNAHVVAGCKKVMIRGAVKPSWASVIARNDNLDLAIVKTNQMPRSVPRLKQDYYTVKKGDPVVIMGYPGYNGVVGKIASNNSYITDFYGASEDDQYIMFADSVQKGNSGGPLIDASGHVIGVITGKLSFRSYDLQTGKTISERNGDVAVNIPTLRKFLARYGVGFYSSNSGYDISNHKIMNRAVDYVVNIHCRG